MHRSIALLFVYEFFDQCETTFCNKRGIFKLWMTINKIKKLSANYSDAYQVFFNTWL